MAAAQLNALILQMVQFISGDTMMQGLKKIMMLLVTLLCLVAISAPLPALAQGAPGTGFNFGSDGGGYYGGGYHHGGHHGHHGRHH
ncbi:MAG: hypothetical protein ABSC72_09155 [Methylovirgula sp.]